MTTVALVLLSAAGFAVATVGVGRWLRARARIDPSRDPMATRVSPALRHRLDTLLEADGPVAPRIADAVELCRIEGDWYWREGLKRVLPLLDGVDEPIERASLGAHVLWAMGHVSRAEAAVAALPADQWRACLVRSGLYAVRADRLRADHALEAALAFAPEPRRPLVHAHLTALRQGQRITTLRF